MASTTHLCTQCTCRTSKLDARGPTGETTSSGGIAVLMSQASPYADLMGDKQKQAGAMFQPVFVGSKSRLIETNFLIGKIPHVAEQHYRALEPRRCATNRSTCLRQRCSQAFFPFLITYLLLTFDTVRSRAAHVLLVAFFRRIALFIEDTAPFTLFRCSLFPRFPMFLPSVHRGVDRGRSAE